MRYNIDIGEQEIRVVKYTKKGVVKRTGVSEMPNMSNLEVGSKEYVHALSVAIKKAGKIAGMTLGLGANCDVVVGGQQIVVRRFVWPDLPYAAQIENAETEIAAYIPGDPKAYVIGHEVLRNVTNESLEHKNIEVIVAAMPKDFARAIVVAARKANFNAVRIDVRENVRSKVVAKCFKLTEPPSSYAILDFSQSQANVSLYLNGVFYSNRYFTRPTEGEYDTDSLSNEVVSIIDYMQYRERGSKIAAVLLMGEGNQAGIEASLKENLDIPIYTSEDWVNPRITEEQDTLFASLDAYGACLPSLDAKNPITLKPALVKDKASTRKLVGVLLGSLAVVIIVLIVAITIPTIMRNELRSGLQDLNAILAGYTVTVDDIAELNVSIVLMEGQIGAVEDFFVEFPQARTLVPVIFDSGLIVQSFNASSSTVNIFGLAEDFVRVSNVVETLRESELIASVHVSSLVDNSTAHPNAHTTSFSMVIILQEGMGER